MGYKRKFLKIRNIFLGIALAYTLESIINIKQDIQFAYGKEPPGWNKGEKKGWTSDVPSGIEKKQGWMPPGLSEEEQDEWKGYLPPGWNIGRKKGWTSNIPPGLEKKVEDTSYDNNKIMPPDWDKWEEKKKKEWEGNLNETKNEINKEAKKIENLSDIDIESIAISIEMSARKGVPIDYTRDIIKTAMLKGIKGGGIEKLTRAISYGVGRDADFDQLKKYVHKNLIREIKDDDLAIEIYKEIARGYEEKTKDIKNKKR